VSRRHGRRKGGRGVLTSLEFEIWYFPISLLVEICFSLSFGVGEVKSHHCWSPALKNSNFGHPLEKSFRRACLTSLNVYAPSIICVLTGSDSPWKAPIRSWSSRSLSERNVTRVAQLTFTFGPDQSSWMSWNKTRSVRSEDWVKTRVSPTGAIHEWFCFFMISSEISAIIKAANVNEAVRSFSRRLEIDRYIGLAAISGRYLGFTDISVSAKTADFIGLSRCWQNAVIFLTHADNLRKKAQRSKSRQLSYNNASRCGFINKQKRLTMERASAVTTETKASSLIRLILKSYQNIEIVGIRKNLAHKSWFWKFLKKGKA